jgi:hypothetical protein
MSNASMVEQKGDDKPLVTGPPRRDPRIEKYSKPLRKSQTKSRYFFDGKS